MFIIPLIIMASNKTRYFFCLLMLISFVATSTASEADSLLKFKGLLSNVTALSNWGTSTAPCSRDTPIWTGLLCTKLGSVRGLQLENMDLGGIIDVDSLVELPNLRTISFMNNSFDSPLPDIKKLSALKTLFLSNNRFSGNIPGDAFEGMNALKIVYMAQNDFTGNIPKSLAQLPKLSNLTLQGNQFQGRIPKFPQKNNQLQEVNLAHNQLEGPIPASLSNMDPSYFLYNKGLCGKPLQACKSSTKKRIILIIAIIAAVVILAAIVAAFFMFRNRRTKKSKLKQSSTATVNKTVRAYKAAERIEVEVESRDHAIGKVHENGKVYFVRNDRERFELQDLLRASAEVLGSGSFGSSYKAVLLNGPAMVVKRFRQMNNVGKEEFHEHMRRLGRFSHPNLLPLVAFYYRKEEKLLVSDFIENGSLASHLHSNRPPGQPGLDWPTRLKIIKGVAKGLAYLYKELPNIALPHGHLKSSNVLLDHTFEPLLTDYSLAPVINKDHAQQSMVAYKSPEFMQYDRMTRKTDVWSLGILIFELITGKFPANYLKQGKGANADLAAWVNSVVREEWTGEVFDKDMKGTKNGEGEMLKLLKIGMCCCELKLERRCELGEAVERIMELTERDIDREDYSSYLSEGDVYSSRALSEDEFSFSLNK